MTTQIAFRPRHVRLLLVERLAHGLASRTSRLSEAPGRLIRGREIPEPRASLPAPARPGSNDWGELYGDRLLWSRPGLPECSARRRLLILQHRYPSA